MTEQHPITPPPELLDQWLEEWAAKADVTGPQVEYVAEQAARWGADQELDACCEVLRQKGVPAWSMLRSCRRPKPLSLKEQALELIKKNTGRAGWHIVYDKDDIIRRALEQLDD